MWDEDKPDAVFIVINPKLHPQLAIEALERGLHVFVEKPPSLTVAEARQMADASGRAGKILAVGFMKRFATGYRMVRGFIDEGDTPHQLEAKFAYGPYRLAWGGPADALGFLLDNSIHFFDLARYFMGNVTRLYAHRVEVAVDRIGYSIVLEFESGTSALLNLSSLQSRDYPSERMELVCEGHSVVVDNIVRVTRRRTAQVPSAGRIIDPDRESLLWEPNFSFPFSENSSLFHLGYAGEVRAFTEAALEERRHTPDIADGIEALRLVAATMKSAETRLPVDMASFADDEAAFPE
jgi:myo-inositol 2-dehydrogenase/D-chiro-inositol 1-dehydrogenase